MMRRKHESGIGRSRKSRNTNGISGSHLPPRTMALAVLALGLVAVSSAMPAAAADKGPVKDDNKWYQCPNGYSLESITLDGDFAWPYELSPYDHNGDGFVCALPP